MSNTGSKSRPATFKAHFKVVSQDDNNLWNFFSKKKRSELESLIKKVSKYQSNGRLDVKEIQFLRGSMDIIVVFQLLISVISVYPQIKALSGDLMNIVPKLSQVFVAFFQGYPASAPAKSTLRGRQPMAIGCLAIIGLVFACVIIPPFWEGLTSSSTPVPTNPPRPTSQASEFIAALDRYVTDLNFFEGDLPQDQRVYHTQFDNVTTSYVSWELTLQYPPPGQRVGFTIHEVWYQPDGSILIEQDVNSYAETDWDSSSHVGHGCSCSPGNWQSGEYTVVLSVAGEEIARGSFWIQ